MNLTNHTSASLLANLAPETVNIAGGSFVENLPNSALSNESDALSVYQNRRKEAKEKILQQLFDSIRGKNMHNSVSSKSHRRAWPKGYTGSMADKAGVVLGAITKEELHGSVGIDLERNEYKKKRLDHTVDSGDIPTAFDEDISTLAAFSTKEAVYKAVDRFEGRSIDYEDISLNWEEMDMSSAHGSTTLTHPHEPHIKCAYRDGWIVAIALLEYNTCCY